MQKMDDKLAFAARLRQALKRSPKKIETAADLAVQFSLRHPGTAISTQSAHKWLTGRSRPTADKLKTLSTWLNVSPSWLLYGTADRPKAAIRLQEPVPITPTAEELQIIEKIRSLPESRRQLVQEIIEICQLDPEVWRDR